MYNWTVKLVLKTALFSKLHAVYKNAVTHNLTKSLREDYRGLEIGRVIKMYYTQNNFKIMQSRMDEVRKYNEKDDSE